MRVSKSDDQHVGMVGHGSRPEGQIVSAGSVALAALDEKHGAGRQVVQKTYGIHQRIQRVAEQQAGIRENAAAGAKLTGAPGNQRGHYDRGRMRTDQHEPGTALSIEETEVVTAAVLVDHPRDQSGSRGSDKRGRAVRADPTGQRGNRKDFHHSSVPEEGRVSEEKGTEAWRQPQRSSNPSAAVPCPVCRAQPGWRCNVSAGGASRRNFHKPRIRAAENARKA